MDSDVSTIMFKVQTKCQHQFFTAAGSNEVQMKDQTEAGNTEQHQGVLTMCRGF